MAQEPITLDEMKQWLKVETNDEDALINKLIVAGRQYVEEITGRILTDPAIEVPEPMRQVVVSYVAYSFEHRGDENWNITDVGVKGLLSMFLAPFCVRRLK